MNALAVKAILFTRPKHILLHCLKLLQQRDNFVLSQFCYFAFPIPLSSLLPQHFKTVITPLALTQQLDSLAAITSFALAQREQNPLHGKALLL